MALIQCPECGETVSSKAETCPHCGIKLKAESTVDKSLYSTIDKGDLLFSTKGLYDSAYWKEIIPGIIGILIISFIIAVVLSWLVGMIIYFVSLVVYCITVTSKSVLFKKSYIEVYENIILGVSCIKNAEGFEGISFSTDYSNITHIDTVKDHEIILHTTHGVYKAQAFSCADKVKNIIQDQVKQH